MENYKIKVNGTHPLEYQDILDVASELGYDNEDWGNLYNVNYLFLNDDGSVGFSLNGEAVSDEHQELTPPQLRDLVVLHRNDVKDGNYKHRDGSIYFITSDDAFYLFSGSSWIKSLIETSEHLIKIDEEPEQGLISGADALRALADGKEVEFYNPSQGNQGWKETANSLSVKEFLGAYFICAEDNEHIKTKFRLKPRTITLSLEIPAPFEPRERERYWFIDSCSECGYSSAIYHDVLEDAQLMQYGAYLSEQDVIAARDALRGIKG